MLYPLKMKPVFKPKIWGGTKLRTYFGKNLPGENIGESWELCCRDDGMNIIENGRYRGKTLQELFLQFRDKLVGSEIFKKYGPRFPLLIKILDANDRLSVQVHPDDACAVSHGLPHGKDEMWYIVDAKKNASLICGLKNGTTKSALEKAVRENRISPLLNNVAVKPGDFLHIPAGTVHAILGGILIAEIQQNCNTTYRLYDWDRTDSAGRKRDLQVPQALQAIHFTKPGPAAPEPIALERREGAVIREGPKVKEFRVDEIRIHGDFGVRLRSEGFQVIMDLNGSGKISYRDGSVDLSKGDTVLIPAETNGYTLAGNMLTLFSHMPKAS